jgi:hypothetical protein
VLSKLDFFATMTKYKILFSLLSLAFIFSCEKKDEEAPIIKSVSYTIENRDSLFAGGRLTVKVDLEDNSEIEGFNILVRQQASTFGYKKYAYQNSQEVTNVASKTYKGEYTFAIFDSCIAAPYLIEVSAYDITGNRSIINNTDIYIYNQWMSIITLIDSSLVIDENNQITPKGNISAPKGTKTILAEVVRDEVVVFSKTWTSSGTTYYWSLDSIEQITVAPGFNNASILIKCTDKINNVSYRKARL